MAAIQFEPTKKQFTALEYLKDDVTNEVLYGGWARWGKSFLGCAWIIMEALSKPWSTWLIGRSELKRLKQTTLLTFHEVLKLFGLSGSKHIKFDEQNSMIKFTDRDVIIFLVDLGYQPSDPNYDRLGSLGLTGYFIDEAQEIHEKAINMLKSRTSNLSGEMIVGWGQKRYWKTIPKVLYTCNPAKNWIYNDFYKPYKNGTMPRNKVFIPSLVTDNTHISEEYIQQLRTADKTTQERLLYGNFDYDDTPWKLFDYDAIGDMWTNPKKPGKRYITSDIARMWADKTVIYAWNGFVLEEKIELARSTTVETADEIKHMASKWSVPMRNVVVDEDWVGGWVVDILQCRGFINNSRPISPLSSKLLPEKRRNYQNLKTQCYFLLRDYVNQSKIHIVPDDFKEPLIEELDILCEVDNDKDWPLKITSKADIKERLGRSPDYSDALMLRMFFEFFLRDEDIEILDKSRDDMPYNIENETDLYKKVMGYIVEEDERTVISTDPWDDIY